MARFRTEAHVIEGVLNSRGGIELREKALTPVALLERNAAENGSATFLDVGSVSWTYAEMWSASSRLAAGLHEAGVRRGDRVLAMLDNSLEAVSVWFAANMVGAVWVPINTALRGQFLGHVISDGEAKVLICEQDYVERFRHLGDARHLPDLMVVRCNDGDSPHVPGNAAVGLGTISQNPLPDRSMQYGQPDDVSLLIYTGGTTGPSKGCVIQNGYVVHAATAFLIQTGRAADEVNWSPLPLFHFNLVSGSIYATMLLGGWAAIAPRFSASRFWPEIVRTGAEVVNLLGAMAAIVATRADENEGAIPYGQIRVVHGAPIPAPIALIWRERFGVDHVGANTFGLTEAFPLTTLAMGEHAPEGSAGRRNEESFDLQIVDNDDRPMGPNEVGELICRPKHPHAMFAGYWKRPDATADVMTNGWFHTGDLGLFDEAGFFFFKDRKKDYLRRRGENISSQEVEATYLSHPAIAQVAVHAVPSDLSEDDVKVTLVVVVGEHLDPGELFEWSKERVPYFALPRYIEIRSELPLSPVGRVHKFQLRAEGCTPDTWGSRNFRRNMGAPMSWITRVVPPSLRFTS